MESSTGSGDPEINEEKVFDPNERLPLVFDDKTDERVQNYTRIRDAKHEAELQAARAKATTESTTVEIHDPVEEIDLGAMSTMPVASKPENVNVLARLKRVLSGKSNT